MYLSYQEKLPQGTPVFMTEIGNKNCLCPGTYQARQMNNNVVCPGCKLLCGIPYICGVRAGDHFIVRKRPSKPQRSR